MTWEVRGSARPCTACDGRVLIPHRGASFHLEVALLGERRPLCARKSYINKATEGRWHHRARPGRLGGSCHGSSRGSQAAHLRLSPSQGVRPGCELQGIPPRPRGNGSAGTQRRGLCGSPKTSWFGGDSTWLLNGAHHAVSRPKVGRRPSRGWQGRPWLLVLPEPQGLSRLPEPGGPGSQSPRRPRSSPGGPESGEDEEASRRAAAALWKGTALSRTRSCPRDAPAGRPLTLGCALSAG